MKNHHFQWENPLLMVIFNSYVKLPEGNWAPNLKFLEPVDPAQMGFRGFQGSKQNLNLSDPNTLFRGVRSFIII